MVWPMIDQEADDGLAAAAARASESMSVEQVLICTPDKDLAQCVRGNRVVQFDRRKDAIYDDQGVFQKFGVLPASIPDYLALVGDAADGFPGIPRWGAKSASAVLARYQHLESIPGDTAEWDVKVRGANALSENIREQWDDALLFRDLATLRTDHSVFDDIEELRWTGPTNAFADVCDRLGVPELSSEI